MREPVYDPVTVIIKPLRWQLYIEASMPTGAIRSFYVARNNLTYAIDSHVTRAMEYSYSPGTIRHVINAVIAEVAAFLVNESTLSAGCSVCAGVDECAPDCDTRRFVKFWTD